MKLYTPLLITFLLTGVLAHAQQYDVQWTLGPNTSVIDFRQSDTVLLYTTQRGMNTKDEVASICNEQGDLLYLTNGIFIADRNGDSLLNGNGLSPCSYTTQQTIHGLPIPQGAIFIPMPANNRYYYLFHCSNDTLNSGRPGTLYYSIIDKEGNFGLGEVVQKNIVYYKGIFREGGMTACKHANGRDWWIIMGGRNNNRYSTFLLTPAGITDTIIQNSGPNYNQPYDVAYSCFSEDGSKYATATYVGYVTVFDFDRCTGLLSNPVIIFNNSSTDPINNPISGGGGVCFSPNGRFLYVPDRIYLRQYDLYASNIQDSSVLYMADSTDFAQIGYVELAPNGKIYGSTWAGGFYFIHVIHRPDEKGDSALFEYAGQPTLSLNSFNLPNMPNYRLGSLAGSSCDTITTGIRNDNHGTIEQPRISPNPADKGMYIEMPQQGNYVFELLNANGQLIARHETRQVDIINTEAFESGIYFLSITDQLTHHALSTIKLAVKH